MKVQASYSSESQAAVLPQAPGLRERIGRALRWRTLVQYLVISNLKAGQHSTVLGYAWWVLDPLLLMLVYYLLVEVIFNRGVEHYPVFVLAAILPWKWFNTSVQGSIGVMLGREQLMRQVPFPKVVLPISQTVANMIDFGFGLLVIFAFVLAYNIEIGWALLGLPLIVVGQFAFTLGIAMFFSAASVFFRDLRNLLVYAFRLWFYLSPALYPLSRLPERFHDYYRILNPFAVIFPAYQDTILYASFPAGVDYLLIMAHAAIALTIGFAVFRWADSRIVKVL